MRLLYYDDTEIGKLFRKPMLLPIFPRRLLLYYEYYFVMYIMKSMSIPFLLIDPILHLHRPMWKMAMGSKSFEVQSNSIHLN